MNRFLSRLGALTLSLALFTLTACGGPPNSADPAGEDPAAVAMGRYVETEATLPENIGYTKGIFPNADGSLDLFCNLTADRNVGPWKIFTSSDGGLRWSEKEVPWLSQFDAASPQVTRDQDGNWYLYYMEIPQEIIDMLDRGEEPPEDFEPPYKFSKVTPDGTVTPLNAEFPRGSRSAGVQHIQLAENGDYIVDDYGSIIQVDPVTMELKHEYIAGDSAYRVPYLTYENTLVISYKSDLIFYDLTTGEKTNSVSFNTPSEGEENMYSTYTDNNAGSNRTLFRGADKALYICDATGIYRHVSGGAVLERLVDGEMTSLNMPALTPAYLSANPDGALLVLFHSGDITTERFSALRYQYEKDTPTVPGKDLRVYSLYDNKTVRQTMGLFQRANPDVHVIYNVGIPTGTAVDVSDALRLLSTELLAGKGPDVLLLDGMPIPSYIEKGVLLDLSQTVTQKLAAGELLEHPANAFKQADGAVYAIPTRFSTSILLGDDDVMASVTDLTSLADYLEQAREKQPDKEEIRFLDVNPLMLLDQFYPLSAPAWQRADGTLDEALFRQFLNDLKRIYDVDTPEDLRGNMVTMLMPGDDMPMYQAVPWSAGACPLAMGSLNQLNNIAMPEAAIREKGSGGMEFLNGQSKNIFLPKSVLGINANSPMQDAAQAFLEIALSMPVQNNSFGDGMPVNTAAFQEGLKDPYSNFDDGVAYGTSLEDGETLMLQVKWPSDAYMQAFAAKLTALDTPFMSDAVVRQMLIEETMDFFADKKTLDETVSAFTSKYNLYLAE